MKHTEETKKKLSESHKGKRHSEETKNKIRASLIGLHPSDESRQKMSAYWKGRPKPLEQNAKVSQSLRSSTKVRRGKDHKDYKDGRSHKKSSDREEYRYTVWRRAVYERDNFTCMMCGQRGKKLHCHHKKSFIDYPEERFNVENGVTLCEECHGQLHGLQPGGPILGFQKEVFHES